MKNFKKNSGFTLIEALAFLFIFSLVTVVFYAVWSKGTEYIAYSKNRLVAVALANEKIEIVRNLAFDDIAHTTGDPAGNLNQNEDVVRGGGNFHVLTQIRNVDDPYDGILGGNPNDPNYIDYKFVKITVTWNNGQHSISLSSRFVPPGIEQPATGKGVLVVNVISDKDGGSLVQGSTIRIQNSNTGFDETHSTDEFGRLMLVGISEGTKNYRITVTKNGYETVSTLPPYPDTSYAPVHEHASVIESAVNTIDIYQNMMSDLVVRTKDYLGASLPNMDFHLKGGKKIGNVYGSDPAEPIYGIDNDYATDGSGEKDFDEVNPGTYEFSLQEPNYKIIGISPVAPFTISPGATANVDVKVSPDNVTALLVKVSKDEAGNPLSGASVHLTSLSGYDAEITTESDGMAFFPKDNSVVFDSGTYDLSISASGYQNYSGQVTVNSGSLKEESVQLLTQ